MAKGNRAAIYARFSSHNQRDESIEIQVEKSREYCEQRGLDVVCVYSDYAQTGRNTARAELQKMMDHAKLGMFDYVVIYKVTRIMRNRDEMALARIMLRQAGVEILYAGETLGHGSTRVLHLGMLEVLAEYESAVDSERIRDGIQKNAKRGMANGQTRYGWDIVDGYYQVNEQEAALLRRMKNMLLSGSTLAEITRAMEGERTRAGKKFTIKGITKLLRRWQNCGVYEYAGVRIEDGMPALWTREEQEMLIRILTHRTITQRRRGEAEEYPLSGKLFCRECGRYYSGTCGTSKSGTRYFYYRCPSCRRAFRSGLIEAWACDAVFEATKGKHFKEQLADAMAVFDESSNGAHEIEAKRLRKEISKIDAAFERIWKAIEDGCAPPGGKDRIADLKTRKAALEEDLAQAEAVSSCENISKEDLEEWIGLIAKENDTKKIIDRFVRFIEFDGQEGHIYFTFDHHGNDFMPTKKANTQMKGCSPIESMVELRTLNQNNVICINSTRMEISKHWFAVITLLDDRFEDGRKKPKKDKDA